MKNSIKQKFKFYNFDNLASFNEENDFTIKFADENATRYCDTYYGGSLSQYEKIEKRILKYAGVLYDQFICDNSVAVRYHGAWVVNPEVSPELHVQLSKSNMLQDCEISLNNKEMFLLLAKSALRYNTFCQFLFVKSRLILTITDHLDMFVSTTDQSIASRVYQLYEMYYLGV